MQPLATGTLLPNFGMIGSTIGSFFAGDCHDKWLDCVLDPLQASLLPAKMAEDLPHFVRDTLG